MGDSYVPEEAIKFDLPRQMPNTDVGRKEREKIKKEAVIAPLILVLIILAIIVGIVAFIF